MLKHKARNRGDNYFFTAFWYDSFIFLSPLVSMGFRIISLRCPIQHGPLGTPVQESTQHKGHAASLLDIKGTYWSYFSLHFLDLILFSQLHTLPERNFSGFKIDSITI